MRKRKFPQTHDAWVADLVRSGRVRVGLFLPQYTTDPVTGELRGGSVFRDIAHALADRIGVETVLTGYQNPREVVQCLKASACDVAFMVPDTSRIDEVGFSPPILQSDFTCLVPADSSIRSMADADRAGIRIAAVRNHASTLALSRILKQAELVTAETPDATLIAHGIQLAVTPVFLLLGIGTMLAVMTNRLARIVDRARVLQRHVAESGRPAGPPLVRESATLARRGRLTSLAIALMTTAALLLSAIIAILFAGTLLEWDASRPVAFLFIGAMLAVFFALVLFLREVFLAAAGLRLGLEQASAADASGTRPVPE